MECRYVLNLSRWKYRKDRTVLDIGLCLDSGIWDNFVIIQGCVGPGCTNKGMGFEKNKGEL